MEDRRLGVAAAGVHDASHPGGTGSAYPPAPWRLRGHAVCSLRLLDIRQVMASLPPGLSVVPVLPGRTLGGLYLAAYGAGSVLAYSELIVVSALVRHRRRLGAWVSYIYVDSSRSAAGGREVWGLPKQLAEFIWAEPPGTVVVRQRERLLCTLRSARRLPLGRLPVFLPAFGRKGEELLWFRGTATAGVGLAGGTFDVPGTSPFAALGFRGGLGLSLSSLDLLVHPPVCLSGR